MTDRLSDAARKPSHKGRQRRYPRYRTDLSLKVTVLRDDGYAELRGRCGDLGEGGFGAVLNAELSPGEVISLDFALPEGDALSEVRAIVRYRKGLVHGFEFLGLTQAQQQKIQRVCRSLQPSTD
ncbi:MAG TPA: PilZ domain-containing protein [Terriglobales bacterium]|nr:PilZ domain-containing protein [Terriglobales bacterium]